MNIISYPHIAGATFSKMLRLFALPAATLLLIALNRLLGGMDSAEANMLAALAIVLAGIPPTARLMSKSLLRIPGRMGWPV